MQSRKTPRNERSIKKIIKITKIFTFMSWILFNGQTSNMRTLIIGTGDKKYIFKVDISFVMDFWINVDKEYFTQNCGPLALT